MSDYYQGLKNSVIVENAELNLVRLFNLVPKKDGNMWCYLLGENLQEGIAGFGKTPYLAAIAFNKAYNEELP